MLVIAMMRQLEELLTKRYEAYQKNSASASSSEEFRQRINQKLAGMSDYQVVVLREAQLDMKKPLSGTRVSVKTWEKHSFPVIYIQRIYLLLTLICIKRAYYSSGEPSLVVLHMLSITQ